MRRFRIIAEVYGNDEEDALNELRGKIDSYEFEEIGIVEDLGEDIDDLRDIDDNNYI